MFTMPKHCSGGLGVEIHFSCHVSAMLNNLIIIENINSVSGYNRFWCKIIT